MLDFSYTASLIAHPSRALILSALMDGCSLPASSFVHIVGVSPATITFHLNKLMQGKLISMEQQGRHHYFRLTNHLVAEAIESLSNIVPENKKSISVKMYSREFRQLRSCYNHLAGNISIQLTDFFIRNNFLKFNEDKFITINPNGFDWINSFEMDLKLVGSNANKQYWAKKCLDCTERKYHIAGPFGNAIMNKLLALGWIRHSKKSRVVYITSIGAYNFSKIFEINL